MEQPSPFADIPAGKENDFRFLLERVYHALVSEFTVRSNAIKSKLSEHEGKIKNREGSVKGLEACPCDKRLDPGKKCPLWTLEQKVLFNKGRNTGIYTGIFAAGALFYYVSQLILAYLRIHNG